MIGLSLVLLQLGQEVVQYVSSDLEPGSAATLMEELESWYSRLLFPQIGTLDIPKGLPQDVSQAFRLNVNIVSSIMSFLI